MRIRKSCHDICCAGTARNDTHADLSGRARISFRLVDQRLFMTGQDEMNIVRLI